MAYTPIDVTLPNQSTQNITNAFSSIRTNDEFLLDQMVMFGFCPGWNEAVSAPYDLPTTIVFTKASDSNRKVRLNYTYDGSNRVSTFRAEKMTDGATWEKIYFVSNYDLVTYTYDGTTGCVVSSTWSASA